MAATYRIIVSSINCYSSVVVDRRSQQAVHYCNGPCQLLRHGLDCMTAHHSTCSDLLEDASSQTSAVPSTSMHEPISRFTTIDSVGFPGSGEDYHQILPNRGKKGLSIQSSTSLKDITGEAINLASGKIKEFSFEKVKYSSSHVTFRKGRKVRPDSFSRRSTDLDIIYGHFGNDENCPPFSLLQKSILEESKLNRSTSLENNINNMSTLYLNSFSEENLITKILEKTKADSSASGEDIKACLDILLKCSEDLKKCTDIIKQCIKRKSVGGAADDSEMIYRNVMARLSSYLKRLPLELEQVHAGRPELGDLADLLGGLHSLQQRPFSPIFGNEQPPRYEDVVQSPPSSGTVHSSLSQPQESQDLCRDPLGHVKPAVNQLSHISPAFVSLPQTSEYIATAGDSPLPSRANGCDSFASRNSLLSSTVCKGSMEALYIEEDADVGRPLNRDIKGEGTVLPSFSRKTNIENFTERLPESGINRIPAKLNEQRFPVQTTFCSGNMSNVASTSISQERKPFHATPPSNNRDDEIDKLLMDLESLSRNIEGVPPAKGDESSQPTPEAKPSQMATENSAGEEEDRALLLRILESIETFAQELVESGTGTGTQTQEREVMRLLQDTLGSSGKAEPVAQFSPPLHAAREVGSTLLIQQTPEVIRIQSKPEKKPGTPPPAPSPGPPAPTPRAPTPPPSAKLTPPAAAPPPASINIPRFYFPRGLPSCGVNLDETLARAEAVFADFEEEKADIYEMGKVAKACGCPLYWKAPMFSGAGGERTGFVSVHSFIATWRKLLHGCHDDASKFVYLLAKPGCTYLEQEDLIPLLQDIVDTHPGLTFLKDAPEFHSRYITTVIQRIFYTVNRSWTGKITMTELRRSNFLQTLALLEEEDDINQITDYFSYEHFYVIYCKFWELDTDHDLFIDPKDLARYNDHAQSNRVIKRLFSGAVTRGNSVQREGRMSYAEFVWFLISEEDKRNPTSIEYWFRCMDLDGDGVLSIYELEFFYQEQCERMEGMGIEPLPFQDLLCQMLDLVKPRSDGKITLQDLKRCKMAHIFYDTFFNLEKYLDHEQRDPFAVQKDVDTEGPEPSDWDKYASEEYEILVAEETANEQLQEGSFEDDYDPEELSISTDIGNKMDKLVISDLSV